MPRPVTSSAALAAPCAIRPAMNTGALGARAQATLETASAAAPITNVRLRPWSSARLPAASSAAERPRLIELISQICAVAPACSPRAVSASVAAGAQ
ncbi:hypothetical protein LUX73_45555 [Actinomadura madurae]|nr:hypothetical protein [Actinomadura madurae]MCQ0011242.1 hypothetical protein [Actinomadura madurae]